MAKNTKEAEVEVDSIKVLATAFFKDNKKDIYSEVLQPYKVPTGVFSLDYLLGGGIPSGSLSRLLGVPSSGKSSEGLLIIKNFLEGRKKRRGLIIPTEARLSEKLRSRSGIVFVDKPEEWEDGTCLVLPMNVYEKIANFLWTLVKANEVKKIEDRENFIIMIDCMDYLRLASDFEKDFSENLKVAGPQYLTKILWSKLALSFNAGQHIFLAISQQSAAPKIDPYSKDPLRQGGSSGGTNIQYQASTVIDFSPRFESDYILQNPDVKYDPKKNDKIGHIVKGIVRKSDNERYDVKFEYCVRYGRTIGNSVWIERELFDQMVVWEFLKRDGTQGSFIVEASLLEELKKIDSDFPDKFRSANRVYDYLESKPEISKHLVAKMKTILP